ncbi:MAG: hypothetical protein JWL97_3410 [Gemmatimonadales bacterium]|nr:hypothetical protein [Gemmatimonadales bacterium]
MTTKEAAWVHPNPLLDSYVVLPDGYQMDRKEAASKGYKIVAWPKAERVATPHQHEPESVVLPRGQVVSRDTAQSAGFIVSARAPEATADPNRSWRSAILSSPEARERTSATVELVTTQSPTTMPVASARAFLRGLPTETTEETTTMTTDNANPERAARLAEINGTVNAFNKQRGYGARTNAPASQSRGASLADVDQVKLRRLSQIRLNALENGTAHEASAGETKKLRYALSVEGMALSTVFTQLAVDTSKLRI